MSGNSALGVIKASTVLSIAWFIALFAAINSVFVVGIKYFAPFVSHFLFTKGRKTLDIISSRVILPSVNASKLSLNKLFSSTGSVSNIVVSIGLSFITPSCAANPLDCIFPEKELSNKSSHVWNPFPCKKFLTLATICSILSKTLPHLPTFFSYTSLAGL